MKRYSDTGMKNSTIALCRYLFLPFQRRSKHMNYAQRTQFRLCYGEFIPQASPLTQRSRQKLIARLAALAGIVMTVGFTAAPAHADGWVTMHGTACKATAENNSTVTYGNELWTGDSAVNIVCPLVTHWGGGNDTPASISDVKIFYGSWGHATCTLFRHSSSWGNQNEQFPGDGGGTGWNKDVGFDNPPPVQPGLEHNNYFIVCSLPAGTALYNVQYKSTATP
jgi:hypothetical protein